MYLKNTDHKIISIGGTCILPGEVKKVDDAFGSNEAVEALKQKGSLEVVEDEAPAQEERENSQTQGYTETGDGSGGKDETPPTSKPLSRMNKKELLEECAKLGIEASEDDDNKTLVEKIKAKTAE